MDVMFKDGKLSVRTEKADLAALLKKISEVAGLVIDVGEGVSASVTISLSDVKFEDAINRILESVDSKNYAATFDKTDAEEEGFHLRKVFVVGKPLPQPSLVAGRITLTREVVREYLKRTHGGVVRVDWDSIFQKPEYLSFYDKGAAERVNQENVRQYGEKKIEELAEHLGIDKEQLGEPKVFSDDNYVGVDYSQTIHGIVVEQAGLTLRVLKTALGTGKPGLVDIATHYYPDITISTEPNLTAAMATEKAEAAQRSDFTPERYSTLAVSGSVTKPAQLLIYPKGEPRDDPMSYTYHLVWKIHFERMTYYVDASTGEIIQKGGNLAHAILQGTVSGIRYGVGPAVGPGRYVDDLSQEIKGLVGLIVRDGTAPQHESVTDTAGRYQFEGVHPVIPWLESRVDQSGFRLFTGFSEVGPQQVLQWQTTDGSSGEFPDSVDTGHQSNIFHQLERGLHWLRYHDGHLGNEPPFLAVHAAVPSELMSMPEAFGETDGASHIKLTSLGGTTSHMILHELMHTAAFRAHGNQWVVNPYVHEDAAVDEGIAAYFACRANGGSEFGTYSTTSGNFIQSTLDPLYALEPMNWDKQGQVDMQDWKHYKNGYVIASILWDLTKESTPNHASDQIVWNAIGTGSAAIQGYRPEDLFIALSRNNADVDLLWTTFSAHGVNLEAVPRKELPGIVTGVKVDWFDYLGFAGDESYEVERQEVGSYDSPALFTSTISSLEDSEATGGKTYRYRARPVGAGAGWSNWAYVTVGDAQASHIEIKALDVVFEPSGQSVISDGGAYLRWGMVGTLPGLVGYKITRTAADGEPTEVTLKGSSDNALTMWGLKNDVEYTFRVVAIDANQDELGLADLREVTGVNNLAPPVPIPYDSREYATSSAMFLSWTAEMPLDFGGFKVHYHRGTWQGAYDGTGLQWCCPVAGGSSCLDAAGNLVSQEFVPAPSPIDVGKANACYFIMPAADTYYMAVSAYDTAFLPWGNESVTSAPVVFFDAEAPTQPSGVYGIVLVHPETHRDGIALSWDASTDNDAVDHYLIKRKFNSGEFAELDRVDAASGLSRQTVCACNESALIGDGRYLYIDSFNDLDCGGLNPGTYSYRIIAVDKSGNRSVASEDYVKVLDPLDLILVVARSSRWVQSPTSYPKMVRKLVGALTEKVPDGSNVGVLVFRTSVDTTLQDPAWGAAFSGDSEARRAWVTEQVDQMLDVDGCSSKLTEAERDQCWRKDYWYLDIDEALTGIDEGTPWRQSYLGSPASDGWNAGRLKDALQTGHRKITILISDWYDNSLIAHLTRSEADEVYDKWGDVVRDYVGGTNILKNVILHRMSTSQAWMSDPTSYFKDVLDHGQETFIGDDRIQPQNVKAMSYQDQENFDNVMLDQLIHCRENLLNEVYRVQPGERRRMTLAADSSLSGVGILLFGSGLTHRLFRPDGSEVPLELVDDVWTSRDPAVVFQRLASSGYDRYGLSAPQAGSWVLEVDGTSLTAPAWGQALAYGTTNVRFSAEAPARVRPGESFAVSAMVAGQDLTAQSSAVTFRLVRPGSVLDTGRQTLDTALGELSVADALIQYGHEIAILDYEGRYPYRFLMAGADGQGHAVAREASGSLFVQGDPPVIVAVSPAAETVDESPSVSVLIADDVKIQSYALRVDGRLLSSVVEQTLDPTNVADQFTAPAADWQPRQVKRLAGRVTWVLAPGEHTVEVTATDTIAQEAAPEIWTFRVGPGLLATDVAGDDYGPGWYSYPTDPTVMPRGALDLEGFRVYRDGSLVSFNVDLKNYYAGSAAPTLATLPMVVDVYLDTDGISGSGRTDLLPGRNALLRPQDAWEYCLTISREGAKLISASGSETPVTAAFNSGTGTLSVTVEQAQLGVSDQRLLDSWGYLVATLGYDGLNTGHVKEVTTLGGTNVFGGGAEGSVDPNIIDLLATGTAQETMLASYSVPQGRLAEVTAYRFANPAPVEDVSAPVLSALVPAGVTAANPPQIGFTASDNWALDLGQIKLWVDNVQVSSAALVVSGNDRLASVRHDPGAALADGRYEVRASATDEAGNQREASWEFVVGASAHIATVGGAARAEGMHLRGTATIVGTAAGGTSWRLESSADGVTWTLVSEGSGSVVAGTLGVWATGAGDDGDSFLRLTVAGDGWEQTDSLPVAVDNTQPEAGLASVGAAAGGLIKGAAAVLGWAADAHLSSWAMSYGAGAVPTSWTALSAGPVAAGSAELPASLGALNTAGLADTLWTLRLLVRDLAGNERETRLVVESDNTAPEALIDAPAVGATLPVGTRVSVRGTAYDHHLESWHLEYGAGAAPVAWTSIGSGTSLANHSQLAVWDTVGLAPGDYALQLTVSDDVGLTTIVQRQLTLTTAPLARIATLLPQAEGFVLGAVEVRGSAGFDAGGSYLVEASADGTAWAPIGGGSAAVTDGVLATWATTSGLDGAYAVRVTASESGGATASDLAAVRVDNTLPVAAITMPAESAGIGGRIEIFGTAADANLAAYTLEWGAGAAPEQWTTLATFSPRAVTTGLLGLWETKGLEVAAYTLRLRATDQAGSVSEVLRAVQVTTDSIAPAVSLSAPADGTVFTAAAFEVSGSVSDTALAIWELAAEPFANGAWGAAQTLATGTANVSGVLHTWDVAALDGRHRLTLTGTDAAGNTAAAAVEVILVHGAGYAAIERVGELKMPPVGAEAEAFVAGAVEVRGSALAPALTGYVLEASADGQSWAEVATGSAAVTHGVLGTWDTSALGDGDHHLRLRVLDAVAPEASDNATVPLDNLPPTLAITEPTEGGMIGGYQYILGTAADEHFDAYTLEVASAATPDLWWPIGGRSLPVTAGNLGTWVVNGDVGPYKLLYAVAGSDDFLPYVVDIEVAGDGLVFVLDDIHDRVRVFDQQGRYLSSIGGGELGYARGLFVKDDEVFVANSGVYGGANAVYVYSFDGMLRAAVPLSAVPADAPFDVAVDAEGLIYTTCESTAAVLVHTRAGELVRTLAPTIEGQQVRYRSIDIDAAGNLYLLAPTIPEVAKVSAVGEYLQGFGEQNLGTGGGQLSPFMSGGQVDRDGRVYLADRMSGIVYQFDASGTWVGVVGPFSAPDCLKVDDEGLLYVGMPFEMGFVELAPSWPVEAAALPEGPYSLRLSATDRAGHGGAASVQIEIERVAPEAEITAPAAGATVSGIVQIAGAATDEHFLRYQLWYAEPEQVRDPVSLTWSEELRNQRQIGADAATAVSGGTLGAWDVSALAERTYALLLRVYDQAGNMTEARVDVRVGTGVPEAVSVAVSAPAVDAALVAEATVDVRGAITVSGGVLDHYVVGYGQGTAPTSWVEISRGYVAPSGTGTLCAWDTTGLVQGDYTLLVRAAGITGATGEARVPVRVSAAPALAVMSPTQGGAVAGVVEVLGTVWDEDLLGYTLERGAGASPTAWEQIASSSQPVVSGVLFRWDTTGLDGQYSFRLRATDAAGNVSLLVRQVAADNTAPVASLRSEISYTGYGTRASQALLPTDSGWLKGSASDQYLRAWRLEYGEGSAPTSWIVQASGTAAVVDGQFATISGSTLPWSVVTYALVVEDRAGNSTRAEVTLGLIGMEEFAPGVVSTPVSAAVSPQGRLYVLDAADSRVAILDADSGALLGRFGGSGTAEGEFTQPSDVATDDAGNVYVLELGGRLQRFDADGAFLASLPIRGSGLTVGEDGTLFVTGKPAGEQYHVRVYDAGGTLLRAFGTDGSGPGLFDSYSAGSQKIARDRFGNLFVSNGDRGAEIFDAEGRFVSEVQFIPGGSGHRYAGGIGVDGNGNLALTLGYQRALWRTRLDGRWLWFGRLYPDVPEDLELSPRGTFVCAAKLWRFLEPEPAPAAQPLARIDAPAEGAMTNQEYVIITGSAAAPAFAGYRLTWAPEANPEAETEIVASEVSVQDGTLGFWRVADLPDGTYRLRLRLVGEAGAVGLVSVTLDRAAPATAAITAPADLDLVSGTVTVRGSADDPNLERYRLDRTSGSSWSLVREGTTPVLDGVLGSFSTASLKHGVYALRLSVYDRAGNVAQDRHLVSVGALRYLSMIGGISSGTAWPQDVAVDSAGQIYVSIGTLIQVYAPDGTHLRDIDGFQDARGLSIDGQDRLLLADDSRVTLLDTAGNILLRFGGYGSGPGQFKTPRCALRAASGRLYVSDYGNHRVQVFDADGGYLFSFGGQGSTPGQLSYPHGLAQDAAGNIYVADTSNARVQVFDPEGAFLRSFGSAGSGAGQFTAPIDLFVDTDGFVTVLDSGGSRLLGFNPDGSAAFSFGWVGSDEGELYQPYGLAYRAGAFYVCDTYNRRVQILEKHFGTVDLEPPQIVIASPLAGPANVTAPQLSFTVSDGSVVVLLDGQPIEQRSGDALGPLSEGEHLLRLEATDVAGNVGTAEVVFVVDTAPPVVSIVSPEAGVVTVDQPLLSYTVSDGSVVVRLDGAPIEQRSGDMLGPLSEGEHLLRVEATDPAGNTGAAEVLWTAQTAPTTTTEETLAFQLDAGPGAPIAGASAYLFSAGGVYLGASAVTDASGQAVFTLTAGSYKIRCDYLGYQFWSETAAVAAADTSLVLSIPHRSVSVNVTGTYAGSEQPRSGLPVYLFTEAGSYLAASRTTDAEGRVSFSLPERGYKVRADYLGSQYWSAVLSGTSATILIPEAIAEVSVTRAGGALADVPVYAFGATGSYLGLSGTSDAAGRTSFRLPAGGYRFRADYLGAQYFSAPTTIVADQATSVPISTGGGTVVLAVTNGAAGPVAGAVCYLFDGGGTYQNLSRTTGALGEAGFDLADGTYRIRVDYRGGSFWTEPFAVPAVTQLELDLGGGTLTLTANVGGAPIGGAATHLFAPDGVYLNLSQATDATGTAHYAVPAGTYLLRCDYLGYQFWTEQVVVAGEAATTLAVPQRTVTITALGDYAGSQQPRADLPVHLFTGAGAYLGRTLSTDANGQVSFDLPERDYRVRVDELSHPYWSAELQGQSSTVIIPEALAEVTVTRDGSGLAEVPVYLLDTAGRYLGLSAPTDENGTALFRLPAQAFRFRADYLGDLFFSADVSLVPDAANPVIISLGGGTLVLTLIDGAAPLAQVPCYLFDQQETYLGASRVSGSDGAVRFDLADGIYRVRADYLGYAFWSDPIAVAGAVAQDLVIPLAPVVVALQREYAGDVQPVAGAPVYLFADSGEYLGVSRTTSAAGEAVFSLPEQSYRVRADYLGSSFWSAPFVGSAPVLGVAEGVAAVTVSLAGEPLSGTSVFVFDGAGVYLGLAQTTDALGQTSFRLPAREYRFAADVQGGRFETAALVEADRANEVSLSSGGVQFGLSVDDGAGGPLAAVPVYVFAGTGAYLGLQQSTDAQGHVSFALADGEYRFRADWRGGQFWTPVHVVPAQTGALLTIPHGMATVHVTASGLGVAGAPVHVFSASGEYLGQSPSTDAGGLVEIWLPATAYRFRADVGAAQYWSPTITLLELETTTALIEANP